MARYILIANDRDNCRVYYRDGDNRLFCLQDDSAFDRRAIGFYACSTAGEPSCAVGMPPGDEFNFFIDPTLWRTQRHPASPSSATQ